MTSYDIKQDNIRSNETLYILCDYVYISILYIMPDNNSVPKCIIPDDHISRRVRGCGERVIDIPKQEKRSIRNANRIRVYSRYRRI